MAFTHLQVRSGFSLLDSTNTIENLVEKASELRFDALAITDEQVLYGVVPFYKACIQYGIKPIIGITVNIVNQTDKIEEQCIFLAKNNVGYQHLLKLSTNINKNKRAGLNLETINLYKENLICIMPVNAHSKLASLLLTTSHDEAKKYTNGWLHLFKDDFYLGVQDHGLEQERQINLQVKAFQNTYQLSVVAVNDVRYLEERDFAAFDCLQAIKKGEEWSGKNIDLAKKNRFLRSSADMEQLFGKEWPEVLKETATIKQKCTVTMNFNDRLLPSFPVPNKGNAHDYLEKICWNNVRLRYVNMTNEISERLAYELKIIQSMDFSDYFLIVWDFIHYAKKKNIMVGPGRGSAAGSIVAYVLGITNVDPLKYGLLFERFLNPERVTMPDIDIDFSDHRRDEVIDYVRNKYGEEYVAQIITFGTFAARSLLRELIKTLDVDQRDASYILNRFPVSTKKPIRETIKESKELKEYINHSPKLKILFSIATKLEGLPRHISTHAAGVVISEKALTHYVPLTVGANDTYLTQFPMKDLEAIGLLKMDFLGLRNLTLLERIMKSISYTGARSITLEEIPDNDTKTYELLQEGLTNGVFQLESQGMKNVLKELKPNSFKDIVAVNALFRPGPMEYIPTFIRRKHKLEKTIYLHPDLAPILKETYGVLVYQEQIMQIAHRIAGYSYGEADVFRRAISKKHHAVIQDQKDSFLQGCFAQGYDTSIAEELFHWIVKFSNYGFNKSHAVAYSKISYQLAYLKAHFPAHFFTELLSSVANQHEKVSLYMKEAKDLHIAVSPPSINKSLGNYTVENNTIRMGLLSIKGVGYQTVKEIIEKRKNGPFTNLFDFCLRVSLKIVNRQMIELLILAGAFDETYANRASLLGTIDQAIEQGELFGGPYHQPSLLPNQIGLKESYTKINDFTQVKKLNFEKEVLGVYVSSHPLSEFRKKLELNGFITLNKVKNFLGQRHVKSVVLLQNIKQIRTKRGDPMAFLSIGDETSDMEAVVFPDLYRIKKSIFKEEIFVQIDGLIEERNNKPQWIINDIFLFDESILKNRERLFLKLTDKSSQDAMIELKKIARIYRGDAPIIIYHEAQKKTYKLSKNYFVNPSEECINAIKDIFGEENVILEQI